MNQQQKDSIDYYAGLIVALLIICFFYYGIYYGIVSSGGVINLMNELGTILTIFAFIFFVIGFKVLVFIIIELYEGIKRL